MTDQPKLTETQRAAFLNWATQRSRPGLGGTLDELRELVAGWLAEARAEAWDEGHARGSRPRIQQLGWDGHNPYRSTP